MPALNVPRDVSHFLHDGLGLWREVRVPITQTGLPALFLDRDGVMVEEVNYLHRVDDVQVLDGVAEAIQAANARNIAVVMVTNQAGVGRGYFSWSDFSAVQEQLHAELRAQGAFVNMVYACGYHEDGLGALAQDHHWRKPNPGMFEQAIVDSGCLPERSIIVGDRANDLAAGRAARLKRGFLVKSGYGSQQSEQELALKLNDSSFNSSVIEDMFHLIHCIETIHQ